MKSAAQLNREIAEALAQPKGAVHLTAKRGPTFREDGLYDVKDDQGRLVARMFRDPENREWYEEDLPGQPQRHFTERWLGSTQKEAVERLEQRQATAPAPSSALSALSAPPEPHVGQLFDHFGDIYEITKIGRDKQRTVHVARRIRDLFGKQSLIDERSFPMRDLTRQPLRPIDHEEAVRRRWPKLVR